MNLRAISAPFNAGETVELKFDIPACGEFADGGELRARIRASDASKWMLGDHYNIRIKRAT